jgi:outer membrane protein assembly factor BamA
MTFHRGVFAAVLVGLATSAAYAQQSDAQNGSTQAVSSAAAPAQDSGDGFVDKAKNWAEDHQILERLNGDIDGWYPRLGGMTRGSGFAVGPGYRFHAGNVLVDLSGAITQKRYKAVDAKVRWLQAYDERVEVWTNYRYEDFPQEDFFGTGFDTLQTDRTSYGFKSHDFTAQALVKPVKWLRTGVTIGYLNPSIGAGSDSSYPSIEALFTDVNAAGLLDQPNFVHTTVFTDVDYRDHRGNPGSGGFYHAAFGIWDDRSFDQYDFRRLDLNLWQYVPLVPSKRHVVSGHFGVSYVNNETGQRVPFYFLPYVGGVDTLRSFREFRFKDENAMWMSAEYKWTLIKYLSVAAFADAGKVAHDWEDIGFSGMKHGYGLGLRVHTTKQTFARIDWGTGGGEGKQLFVKLGIGF